MLISVRPLEDFSRSLDELGSVLSMPVKHNDTVLFALVRDARIYAFVKCSEVFQDFLRSVYEASEYYDDDHDLCDSYVEHLLAGLCLVGVLNEGQLRQFMSLFCMCAFFALDDESLFESQEQRDIFQKGVEEIPTYYYAMSDFLEELSKNCELVACDEEASDEH